jgi:hypothetical protein
LEEVSLFLPDILNASFPFVSDDFLDLSSSCCWRFLSFNSHYFASKERVIQISGGTCANLHTNAFFEDDKVLISSSEPAES